MVFIVTIPPKNGSDNAVRAKSIEAIGFPTQQLQQINNYPIFPKAYMSRNLLNQGKIIIYMPPTSKIVGVMAATYNFDGYFNFASVIGVYEKENLFGTIPYDVRFTHGMLSYAGGTLTINNY